jgi:hypothetical protein
MKFLPGNVEDLEQLRERHERLLREFERLKDENRQLKDQLDFDEAGWKNDISTLRKVCTEHAIPHAEERSRSGNGGHVWFFFRQCTCQHTGIPG